jgi:outer membrane protein
MNKFLIVFLILLGFNASAQTKKPVSKPKPVQTPKTTFKMAYIYEDYILDNYKEVKRLDEEIKKTQDVFQDTFNKLAIEYQTKLLDYQNSLKNIDSLTTESLNKKLTEVQEAQAASESFQREAEKQIQQMLGDGIQKVKGEIKTAAEKVAKARGYGYVLLRNKNESLMSRKMVLYAGDGGKDNISDGVLLALGSPAVKK